MKGAQVHESSDLKKKNHLIQLTTWLGKFNTDLHLITFFRNHSTDFAKHQHSPNESY